MDIQKDFLKRKTSRKKKKKTHPTINTKDTPIHTGLNKIQSVEVLFKKAKNLYQMEAKEYDIDIPSQKIKEKKWTADILKNGTFDDKISSLALYIKGSPKWTLKYVDEMLKMALSKNRKKIEAAILALKDLFLETLLNEKKLIPFYKKYSILRSDEIDSISNEELVQSYIDDTIHRQYLKLIEIIEQQIKSDPLKALKKKYMGFLLEMISKLPEGEEKILDTLINKLGDPEVEISNHAIKLLKTLQEAHPRMSLVILKSVESFFTRQKEKGNSARYYPLVFLTQMNLFHSTEFMEYSLNFFFDLFTYYSNDDQSIDNPEKYLSLIVKRINSLCSWKHAKTNLYIQNLINEKMKVLFRLSHSKTIKLSIEVLKLIFSLCVQTDMPGNENTVNYVDRYYKSLYELILSKEIVFSKHLKDLLKLIMRSLMHDTNLTRVAAFCKRLLQMSLLSEPPFITCVLIIISQILRNKHKLWKMIDKPAETTSKVSYDYNKRDPEYSNADHCCLHELSLLTSHYHPSVQKFSKFILENFNKDIITYEGDPLVDFSLVNFLEKFMLKNPKIKKEKKIQKVTDEEENLKKFMEEDKEEKSNDEKKTEIKQGEYDFDFINKFNEMEHQVSSSKNYLKKLKKQSKKVKGEVEDGEENAEGEADIEAYADKVMDNEYEKYDKDIDESEDEAADDIDEENE